MVGPGRIADGRYDVAKWQVFISTNFTNTSSQGQH